MSSMYEPPAEIAHLVQRFEDNERRTEASAANLTGGPTRVLPFIVGADPRTRPIPHAFLERFEPATAVVHGQAGGAALTILATSRPGDLWIGDDLQTAEVVAELIAEDLHCDVRLLDGADFGTCVDRHREVANLYASVNGASGRRNYVAEHFHTVPFDRGGTVVLCRACDWCWNALLLGIDSTRCGVIESNDDGFGSVGMAQVDQAEYRWDTGYVRSVIDEFRATFGRNPTIAELSETLMAVEFVPQAGESKED
ncbi:hypothetical protein E4P42_00400 [Mycobacterium sp. PS03-16]|uniref:hypothetical protein n=1 Tax=Mycobacterium sp. PS03-16 TaxID=2559611 RepID=UPI001073BE52|nr:hypothetical protein [Mycobacterium sp. PS03-16]TFV61397.1 hypothetical protein E4P42_00400 [Mycobacterium sp. PS03-16]